MYICFISYPKKILGQSLRFSFGSNNIAIIFVDGFEVDNKMDPYFHDLYIDLIYFLLDLLKSI